MDRTTASVRDSRYAWIVVTLLAVAFTASFLDRAVLNLLVDPVKRDLGVSDTQMSLLQGAGFISSYLLFGLLFGRLADVSHRRNIILFGVATWSAFTIGCGFAESYEMLLLMRMGVGAAEAALGPCAISIILDYFTKDRLPRALSIQYLGPYLGGGLALVFGGMVVGSASVVTNAIPMLAGLEPWQIVFVIVGAPGFLVALAMLAIREPERIDPLRAEGEAARHFSLGVTLSYIWRERSFYVRFIGSMTLIVLVLFTLPAWMPSLLIRAHGMDPRDVGLIYGPLTLIGGSIGVLSGPTLNRWLSRHHPSTSVMLCIAGAGLALVPSVALIALAPNAGVAIAFGCVATLCFSMPQAIASSALHSATPNRMRGVVQAIYIFSVTGIGQGLGPTLVALITDHVFADPAAVRYSMPLVCATSGALAAWLAISAIPHFRRVTGRDPMAALDS